MMFKQSLIDFIHRAAVCNFKLIVALILDILHMAADTGADTGRNLGGCDIYQVTRTRLHSGVETVMLA